MASPIVARMDDPPTRPISLVPEAREPACARCGGPRGDTPPVAVPDLCGACITALQRVVVRAGRRICDDCEAEGER